MWSIKLTFRIDLSSLTHPKLTQIISKMSIGKIDCTSQKKLCKRFNVKGYPTLKYYRDGDFYDYPMGRDKDSIM